MITIKMHVEGTADRSFDTGRTSGRERGSDRRPLLLRSRAYCRRAGAVWRSASAASAASRNRPGADPRGL